MTKEYRKKLFTCALARIAVNLPKATLLIGKKMHVVKNYQLAKEDLIQRSLSLINKVAPQEVLTL